MYGFMGNGAMKASPNTGVVIGQMGSGALERKMKVQPEVKEEVVAVEDAKETTKEPEVVSEVQKPTKNKSNNDVDLSKLHYATLKKMALEKGYKEESFEKDKLISFLQSLPNDT